jgi:diadenosine tetraphosphatase ApaH/serine/threonine PP2A family protein phosphatase
VLHSARELTGAHRDVIAGWPASILMDVPGLGGVLFCHATPRSDTDIFTRLTPEERLRPVFDGVASVVVCGHTHAPFDRMVGATRVVNAGSVGMPFGEPGADWVLLGPGVEHRRTAYDLNDAGRRIRATTYPQAEDFAARNVIRPPTEAEMLAAFSTKELR